MDIIKDRNDKDLIEEIKRWKEYTEEQYKKKNLNDTDNNIGVVTYPEPDINEVKWALGSTSVNKVSGGCDGIPAELFKILKDDAFKCYTQYPKCQQIWKT